MQLLTGEASIFSMLLNKSTGIANETGNDTKSSTDADLYDIIEQLVDRIKKPIERTSNLNSSKKNCCLRYIMFLRLHLIRL